MVEIDIAKVNKQIKDFFKRWGVNYPLTERVRLDMLVRKYAPHYLRDRLEFKEDAEVDCAIIVADNYLHRFHGITLFPENMGEKYGSLRTILTKQEAIKINEEDRRIEEMEVWKF